MEEKNPARDMPTWVFSDKLIKMSIMMVPILVLLLYLTFRDVKKTEKPKTEQGRQQTNSLNK